MKFISFTILFFTLSLSFSQEICDNGIDDDGNGLIDLQDATCQCFMDFTPISLIPNHSFEDTNCCPMNASAIHCAVNWQHPSRGTADFNHGCSPPFGPRYFPLLFGSGYVGYFDFPGGSKEYVGACLHDTLFAGIKYKLKIQIAYDHGPLTHLFAIFGSNQCSNLPFSTTSVGCPLSSSSWIELDEVSIKLIPYKWNEAELSFTPSINITTIILGPGCKSIKGNSSSYYYMDNVILNEVSKFGPLMQISTTGTFCKNNLILKVDYDSIPNSIQWYKDSIAIIGESSNTFTVTSNSAATYQVKLEFDSGCIIKNYQTPKNEEYELEMPNVFSPNNDYVNDIFKPIEFNCITEATLNIYNRWGQIVHESSETLLSWDGKTNGKDCSSGVYFWTIDLNGKEGKIRESGNVTLFR